MKKLRANIADYKLMIKMVSEQNIGRLREFMARMVSRGASAKMIVKQLDLAIDNKYVPRSDVTEDDLDKAEMSLIIGGPKMLHGLQRIEGFVCQRLVMSKRERKRFITSWNHEVQSVTVKTNMENFIFCRNPGFKLAIHHLMIDDVA